MGLRFMAENLVDSLCSVGVGYSPSPREENPVAYELVAPYAKSIVAHSAHAPQVSDKKVRAERGSALRFTGCVEQPQAGRRCQSGR